MTFPYGCKYMCNSIQMTINLPVYSALIHLYMHIIIIHDTLCLCVMSQRREREKRMMLWQGLKYLEEARCEEGTREKDDVMAQQMCLTCDKVHVRY